MAPAKSGGVDIWADLLIACLVVFVVLAPAFIFRLPADQETSKANKPPARASIYNYGRSNTTADSGSTKTTFRRRAKVQQRPSGVLEPNAAATKTSKSAAAAPRIQQKKAL
jgi:hypothetical protein